MESCCLGRLIQGSQNLELPERETVLFFSLVRKERGVPQRFANLWTPGERFKALPEIVLVKLPATRAETGFSRKTAAKKALNRCDAPALQREDLERTAKEWPYAFVDSRLWLRANLQRLWWKRGALGSDKERLVQKKSFWFIKG